MNSQAPKITPSVPSAANGKAEPGKAERSGGAPPRSGKPGGVVHESEVQRQHARVRLPATIEVGEGRDATRFRVHDLSASGFSFDAPQGSFRQGDTHKGNLVVTLDQISLTFAVHFLVRSVGGKGRVGAGFHNLGAREISALRHLITSYLAGEIVSVGDVLHTLSRENFTGARAQRDAAAEEGGSRTRATITSLMVLVAGVSAAIFAAGKLHDAMFVSTATAAKVAGPVYTVAMPREGTFYSLVPPDGVVKKGAPLASYESPVLDLVRSQAINANLTPEQVDRMLRQTVKGTITSPCDCRVQSQLVAEAQFVNRGQPLFELIPRQFKSFVVARFRHDQVAGLSPGTTVHFKISGSDVLHSGKISQLRVPGMEDHLDGGVIAMVEPDEPLPNDLVNRPAEVSVGGLTGLSGLFNPTETATANDNDAL